jgi:hypothetical protein
MAHKHFVLRRTNQHQGMFPQAIIITPPRGRADLSEVQTRTAYKSNMYCPMSLILHREGPIRLAESRMGSFQQPLFSVSIGLDFLSLIPCCRLWTFLFPQKVSNKNRVAPCFLFSRNYQIWIESEFQHILAILSGHFASRATGDNSTAATWTDTVLSATQSLTVFICAICTKLALHYGSVVSVHVAKKMSCLWEASNRSLYKGGFGKHRIGPRAFRVLRHQIADLAIPNRVGVGTGCMPRIYKK